jgi:hypothetical protein
MAGLGISEAMELARKATELVKGLATIGLQETIMDLRQAILNVKDELLHLREENQTLKAAALEKTSWSDTASKYTLVKAPGGAMVQKTDGPPEHYVCPKCFEDRKVYPLQDKGVMSGHYGCPGCNKSFAIDAPRTREPNSFEPRGGGPQSWMRR